MYKLIIKLLINHCLWTQGVCAVCGSEAQKTCSGCGSVSYCGVEHQKADWGSHRRACSAVILRTSPTYARHFVAARKLKAGTLVLREPPLLVAPRGLVDSYDTPVCLGCSVLMDDEKSQYRCSKCSWPTCSWTCEQVGTLDRSVPDRFKKLDRLLLPCSAIVFHQVLRYR